ncbi:hypothetical protein LINPERPRIM_LOCUS23526 [Linum perenne]
MSIVNGTARRIIWLI